MPPYEKYKLLQPCEVPVDAIRAFAAEFRDNGESTINGSCGLNRFATIEEWLVYVAKVSKNLAPGRLPSAIRFLADGDKLCGIMDLRLAMNDEHIHNGHIGLSIAPSERGKRLASYLLRLGFDMAREHGYSEVVISCDSDNFASKAVIEREGCVFYRELLEDNGNLIYMFKRDLTR